MRHFIDFFIIMSTNPDHVILHWQYLVKLAACILSNLCNLAQIT